MVKRVDAEIVELLNAGHFEAFVLVDLDLNGETSNRRYTSLGRDITTNGVTYSSDGGLLGITAPRQTTVLDRQSFSLVLADADGTVAALSDNNSVNTSPVRVLIGYANQFGVPIRDGDDNLKTLTAYEGVIDGAAFSNSDGQRNVELGLSSPFAAFGLISDRITSPDFQQSNFNADDTCFDSIAEGSGKVELSWGRI